MTWWGAAAALLAGLVSCLGTRALVSVLRKKQLLDRPNERSLHEVPTPLGGGIAVVAGTLLGWAMLGRETGSTPALLLVPLATCLLAIVSWIDDLRGLSPQWRLLAQIPLVALGVAALPQRDAVFQGWLPPLLDALATGLLWLWFVNLFNFMDGIDGLDGAEAAAIGCGLLLFATIGSGLDPREAGLAACVAAAAIGFLVWNWAPARIFLGDVGSVPLGYLLGFMLIDLAARGHWKIALILPLYFLADATITLLRRLLRGERIWQAHRQHFYQRAVQGGLGHAAVVERVIAANLGLIACGWAAENGGGVLAVAAALAVVTALLLNLARRTPGGG
jgi:UDP-N-acetylmuramyl pentapeptide phosphotransferase/UDP-N-acetylglucosamine-1-phosphate transferase